MDNSENKEEKQPIKTKARRLKKKADTKEEPKIHPLIEHLEKEFKGDKTDYFKQIRYTNPHNILFRMDSIHKHLILTNAQSTTRLTKYSCHIMYDNHDEDDPDYEDEDIQCEASRNLHSCSDPQNTLKESVIQCLERANKFFKCTNCELVANSNITNELICLSCQLTDFIVETLPTSDKFDCSLCGSSLFSTLEKKTYCSNKHPDKVCIKCFRKLSVCPFCRQAISIHLRESSL